MRTVEQCRELDVNEFNQEGHLNTSQSGHIRWTRTRDEKEVASIGWRFEPGDGNDVLVLSYTVTPRYGSGDSRELEYGVPVEWTPCNFGGERPWFRCPRCDDRVVKLYSTPVDDRYICRECGGLLYESQTHRSAIIEVHERLETAREQLQEGYPASDQLRDYYEARQGWIDTFNDYMAAFDARYGDRDRRRINDLPPFDVWVDRRLHQIVGAGVRPYGQYGRCTATAKTTTERCRQPATGEHGKCYYHGGAPGSGIGKGQTDHCAKRIKELLEDGR